MRDEEIERRCLNWARWKLGGGGGSTGYARVSPGMEPSGSRYRESRIPTNDCEAEETDRAIRSLDPDLAKTVTVHYTSPHGFEWQARELGIAVATMYRRIERAHALLARWIEERRRDAVAERQRLAALQASARR